MSNPMLSHYCPAVFFFKNTATNEIYTLSLHDALPIWLGLRQTFEEGEAVHQSPPGVGAAPRPDRKSTRLNSSHVSISYAVFCLKKKNTKEKSGLVQVTYALVYEKHRYKSVLRVYHRST